MLVTFKKSGRSVDWTQSSYSLLEFAEEQGLSPAFSCRVDYFEEPLDEPEAGEALLCCSKPLTDVVLDL
jgi:ferredoxin